MVEETVKSFGSPDVLINNAGINVFNEPLKMSKEEWKREVRDIDKPKEEPKQKTKSNKPSKAQKRQMRKTL